VGYSRTGTAVTTGGILGPPVLTTSWKLQSLKDKIVLLLNCIRKMTLTSSCTSVAVTLTLNLATFRGSSLKFPLGHWIPPNITLLAQLQLPFCCYSITLLKLVIPNSVTRIVPTATRYSEWSDEEPRELIRHNAVIPTPSVARYPMVNISFSHFNQTLTRLTIPKSWNLLSASRR